MILHSENIIGRNLSSTGNKKFKSYNPSTNKNIGPDFFTADAKEIEKACEQAKNMSQAFFEIGAQARLVFLKTICSNLKSNEKELINWFVRESGLSEARAKLELDRTTHQILSYGNAAVELFSAAPKIKTEPPINSIQREYFPIGPIAVFGASNFPFAYSTAGGDTASALAAACPVIVKGHPLHPITGHLVGQCIQKAAINTDMPDGVFSYLNSNDHAVGEKLVLNEAVKGVGFTGSIQGGRAIFDIAAKRETLIPVFAEMGSINPVFISNSALKEKNNWAKEYAQSISLGVGQFCTSPGVIFGIDTKEFNDFSKELTDLVENSDEQIMLGTSIKSNYQSSLARIGVKTEPTQHKNGIKPTIKMIDADAFKSNADYSLECFGSFCLIVRCSNLQEVEQCIDLLEGQLTCSIIAKKKELSQLDDLIYKLKSKCGRLIFNGVSTGVAVHPLQHHGGPYPASTDSRFTAVGNDAILRWVRPIAIQNTF